MKTSIESLKKNSNQRIFKIIAVIVLLLVQVSAFSQKNTGDAVLTVGVSRGLIITEPSFNTAYDFAVANKFSLGLGLTYTDCTDQINSAGTLTRTNIGLRPLFHFGNNPNWDFYTGFRLGASFWAGSGHENDGGEFSIHVIQPGGSVIPTVQTLAGIRYLSSGRVGLNSEIAFGFPYTYSLGISVKIAKVQ